MKSLQFATESARVSEFDLAPLTAIAPQLVLVFGSVEAMTDTALAAALSRAFPDAQRVGCSTAGEISDHGVSEGGVVITAIRFDRPQFRVARTDLADMDSSGAAGRDLALQLADPELRSVLVFGQGVRINGSALIDGITATLGSGVTLTGGLAGDGGAFRQTWTLANERVSDRQIVAIGLYGDAIKMSHGSFGGWQPFGPARKVTRSSGNVLYSLDGEPALQIYKRYLGEYAKDLPASGLLFPFAMLGENHREIGLIRTILGINEADSSLVLAGDVAEDGYLRLMHASTNALIEGAEAAATAAQKMFSSDRDGVAILVSCVGRKLVMGGRVDEEVEAVARVFGSKAKITGFYSNGEISPYVASTECALHNQTMTITYLAE